jgi:hypothetical protein
MIFNLYESWRYIEPCHFTYTRRNLVHFNHHFVTTMRLLSKPITFGTRIFVSCVSMQLQVYTTKCVTKWCTTRKCGFSKGQLDQNVHINPKVCPFWLKVWGMKNTNYIWLVHLTKVTFLTKCQVEDQDKYPSKWPYWMSIRFNQIDHPNLTLSQIDDNDLTLSQMNHTHLMT